MLRAAFATMLAAAGLSHAVLASRGQGDVARHALFVGINLAAAAVVAFRPRWALGPIAVLAAQQTYSHGSDLLASMQRPGPFDGTSLGVLLFFAALLTVLIVERRAARISAS
jgi:hypothetical protein